MSFRAWRALSCNCLPTFSRLRDCIPSVPYVWAVMLASRGRRWLGLSRACHLMLVRRNQYTVWKTVSFAAADMYVPKNCLHAHVMAKVDPCSSYTKEIFTRPAAAAFCLFFVFAGSCREVAGSCREGTGSCREGTEGKGPPGPQGRERADEACGEGKQDGEETEGATGELQ